MKPAKFYYGFVLTALIGLPGSATATVYNFDYIGWFTIYDPMGAPINNFSAGPDAPYFGWRTEITGAVTWDDVAMVGTDVVDPFTLRGGSMILDTVVGNAIGDFGYHQLAGSLIQSP